MGVLLAGPPGALTLDSALAAARAQNMVLPLAREERSAAAEDARIADADRFLKVAVEGDLVYAPVGAYDPALTNLGEERLVVIARQPLYSGGEIDARRRHAQAALHGADARYRVAERDLELDVTSAFATLIATREEMVARENSVERFDRYIALLDQRRAAGDPVTLDLHRARVRRSRAAQDRIEAFQRSEDARIDLNVRMGRDPKEPIEPVWTERAAPGGEAGRLPDAVAADADVDAADADLAAARGARRPHFLLAGDAGFWGGDTVHWGTASERLSRDGGASLSLFLVWPVFDAGLSKANVARARVESARARLARTAAERSAEALAAKAVSARTSLATRLSAAAQVLPDARDAYLEAESRYRGGVATATDVLDAEEDEVNAEIAVATTRSELRIADALARRWGSE